MKINGYELTGEWKNSQCGKTAVARKNGKKYFLKQYQTPAAPIDNGTLDAKTFAHNKALFDHFLRTRKTVNSRIRTITGSGGNIVIPAEEFMLDNHYVEAAEYVEGVVPEEELERVLAGLRVDVKKLLMQTAAGALSSIHKLGIIHSDLKLKNVLLVRNAAGNYVAKLIDFDSSYPVDDKPDEIVGDINYYSPELGAYSNLEDEEELAEAGEKLTDRSDIFSLGLIFHFYLSGGMPEMTDLPDSLKRRREKGKMIYPWMAVNSGGSLVISPVIENLKYRSLIGDMLQPDPKNRPSALDVLKRLKGDDSAAPAPGPAASGPAARPKKITGFCTPWEAHEIVFDQERIRSRGFVGAERKTMGEVQGYLFYREDASSTFFKPDMLKAMKYAVPAGAAGTEKPAVSAASPLPGRTERTAAEEGGGTAEPWPEHGIRFDMDRIRAKGFTGIAQATLSGVRGYELTRSNSGRQFMRAEMLIVQKMAEKV